MIHKSVLAICVMTDSKDLTPSYDLNLAQIEENEYCILVSWNNGCSRLGGSYLSPRAATDFLASQSHAFYLP